MLLFKQTALTAGDVITEVSSLVKDATNDIWSAAEKLYALKQTIRKLYPEIFVPAIDTSLSTSGTLYNYTIPVSLDVLLSVRIRPSTTDQYEDISYFVESTTTGNILQLQETFDSGLNMKLVGGTRLSVPDSTSDALDVSKDAEDLVITGMKIELYEMLLLDKGKMNQFAAREQEVTEVDIQNMIESMKREYTHRKGEINSILLMQVTRL